MDYQFILSYQATDSDKVWTNTCHPIYGDDLSVAIDRENGEWYYKRRLDGTITFVNEDYSWIMARAFDGTFTLIINESHDGGTTWHPYFESSFSRANLEIDEDNHAAVLSSFIEGVYNAIENGKNEDYDLMKLIPDGDAKTVQGQVPPALALVDYRSATINKSDLYCGNPIVGGGYASESGFSKNADVRTDSKWYFCGVIGEAKVEMNDSSHPANGTYVGFLQYTALSHYPDGSPTEEISVRGRLYKGNDYYVELEANVESGTTFTKLFDVLICDHRDVVIGYSNTIRVTRSATTGIYTPTSFTFQGIPNHTLKSTTIYFHYIRAALLTMTPQLASPNYETNVLDTGGYYTGMRNFNNNDGGLQTYISSRTVEQPNGHRLVPGTGEMGTAPQYFAPPDDNFDYIPLAEDNWTYASMWYTIEPSVDNGLIDPSRIGNFQWSRCWTIGTVLRYLLDRITDSKVVFTENSTSSRFLYDAVNPVAGHEPFDYLITQKSNVMNPGGANAQRCVVRLQWFLELLHNAFNCYYWLEKQNDGRYLFRVEHVEYCRKGGRYDGDLDHSIDITTLKPRRNFRNRLGQLAKTYADQTNKYAYNMQNLVEKYTFSWQGDGGSDAFKGNPMFFKAGWIEKGSSEDHQVDNIFTDLAWLMLNAGSDTASSKNYDGVFLFSGYRPAAFFKENYVPTSQYMTLAEYGKAYTMPVIIWFYCEREGETYTVEFVDNRTEEPSITVIDTITTTGQNQYHIIDLDRSPTFPFILRLNFGAVYSRTFIYRVHAFYGNVYNVPNTSIMFNLWDFTQNGPLAWPWLQNEYLHYDIPAQKWSYDSDDISTATFISGGTVKMIQKQTVKPVPIADKNTENNIMSITGIRTSIEGGKTGIITNAKVNLSSRNAELTIVYDPIPPQQ